MYHLITSMRRHRLLGARDSLAHGTPVESVEEAIAEAQKQARDNYADPLELQHEDRTTYLNQDQLKQVVNGRPLAEVLGE